MNAQRGIFNGHDVMPWRWLGALQRYSTHLSQQNDGSEMKFY